MALALAGFCAKNAFRALIIASMSRCGVSVDAIEGTVDFSVVGVAGLSAESFFAVSDDLGTLGFSIVLSVVGNGSLSDSSTTDSVFSSASGLSMAKLGSSRFASVLGSEGSVFSDSSSASFGSSGITKGSSVVAGVGVGFGGSTRLTGSVVGTDVGGTSTATIGPETFEVAVCATVRPVRFVVTW